MKKIFTIILLFLSLNLNAQDNNIKQKFCFEQTQVVNIYNNIRFLQNRITKQDELLNLYRNQIKEYKELSYLDSLRISNLNYVVKEKDTIINNYKFLYQNNKPKWYENKYLWFGGCLIFGVLIIK